MTYKMGSLVMGPFVTGTFSDGTFCDGSFCDGTFCDGTFWGPYRESDTRFSTSDFFHKSVSPGPLSIPVRHFQIFSEIHGDICE